MTATIPYVFEKIIKLTINCSRPLNVRLPSCSLVVENFYSQLAEPRAVTVDGNIVTVNMGHGAVSLSLRTGAG